MPIEEKREYTENQIKYYLKRVKRPEKRLKWETLLKEAKESKRPVTLKLKRTKIKDNFKSKTISEETGTYKEIKMNPQKIEDRLLTKGLKKGANKKRIKKQMNKTKGMMEYETTIWGEQAGQTTIIARWTETNKSLKQLIDEHEKVGITEGNEIDATTYNQNIKEKLGITDPWIGGKGSYQIKSIILKTRMIKG